MDNFVLKLLLEHALAKGASELSLPYFRLAHSSKALKCAFDTFAGNNPVMASEMKTRALIDALAETHLDGDLLNVLRVRKLLDKCDRDWLAHHFSGESTLLYAALYEAGLITADAGPDWYARHLPTPAMSLCLIQSGLYKRVSVEWCDANKATSMVYIQAGLTEGRDYEWCAARFDGIDLIAALKESGAIVDTRATAKFSRTDLMADFARHMPRQDPDYYARHVLKKDLATVLRQKGVAGMSRDWLAKHLHKADVYSALLERQLVTAEPGADWYARNVAKKDVYSAIDLAGLWTSVTLDWIKRNVAPSQRAVALKRARDLGVRDARVVGAHEPVEAPLASRLQRRR